MKVQNISWQKFRVAFAGPFGTARANLKLREGYFIQLTTDNGLVGLGEAAPLPEFGGGTAQDVVYLLSKWADKLVGCPLEAVLEGLAVSNGPGVAALRCGLDTALCDLLAQAQGQSIAEWLANGSVAASVPVNATIAAPDNRAAARLAREAVRQGFSCVKLKVGMAQSVAGEVERVGAVRAALGDGVKLRLDANAAWTNEQAIATLQKLEKFDIELIEQPVAAADLPGMAQVRKATTIPIAADEAITGLASAQTVIAAGAADILVIKPMIVGGLRVGREISAMAQAAGLRSFVTTTIDTGVGIAAALHLAATLPAPVLACGLATAVFLETTLVAQLPEITDGRMFLPNVPGLGVSLQAN